MPTGCAMVGPDRQLDHILTDDRSVRAQRCWAPMLLVSDHRALVVDIARR